MAPLGLYEEKRKSETKKEKKEKLKSTHEIERHLTYSCNSMEPSDSMLSTNASLSPLEALYAELVVKWLRWIDKECGEIRCSKSKSGITFNFNRFAERPGS